MSHDIVLFSLLKNTFALLLENEDIGDHCELLAQKLDVCIEEIPTTGTSNDLPTSLSNLRNAVGSLCDCFENLNSVPSNSNSDCESEKEAENELKHKAEVSQANDEVSKSEIGIWSEHPLADKAKLSNDAKLLEEVQDIENKSGFEKAMKCFREVNKRSKKAFEKEAGRETKITATKVRLISEILGNLTNLSAAAENCKIYIKELHKILNGHQDAKDMKSVIHINVVLFRFIKEFLGQSVAMLDWPMINKSRHPILGKLSTIINPPDPFTHIDKIDSSTSAVNCNGEIFAKELTGKENTSSSFIRIKPNGKRRYSIDDNHKIVSLSIDCGDCKTCTEPSSDQFGESSTQRSEACSKDCNGKIYILACRESPGRVQYFLFTINMEGNIEHKESLGFIGGSEIKVLRAKFKVFCIKDKRVIILKVTMSKSVIHICDSKGKLLEDINITPYLSKTNVSRPPIFTYNAEMIVLESKLNFRNKLIVYDILVDEEGGSLTNKSEIYVNWRAVQAVAFNQKLDELTILCYSIFFQYHLVIYKRDGELKQDIELHNGKYWKAGLISHRNNPLVLLDNDKVLYLKK